MPCLRTWLIVLTLAVGLAGAAPASIAASPESVDEAIASIKQTLEQLKAQGESAQQKKRISTYQNALSAYQSAADYYDKIDALAAKVEGAREQIATYQAEREQVVNKKPGQVEADSATALADKTAVLERQLESHNAALDAVRERLARLAQLPSQARSTLRELRAKRREQKQMLGTSASGQPTADQLSQAESALAEAKRAETAAHIAYLEKSLATLEVRKRLANAKRALLKARVSFVNRRLTAVTQALIAKRKQSAQELASEAGTRLSALKTGDGLVQKSAQENVALARSLVEWVGKTDDISEKRAALRGRLETVQRRLNLVHQQLQIGAGSVALGELLRGQLHRLPKPGETGLSSEEFGQVANLASVQLANFQLAQRSRQLMNLEKRARELAETAGVTLNQAELETLVDQLRLRRQILERLQAATARFIDVGRTLRQLSSQYDETLADFREFLNERLFWLPSAKPLDAAWFGRLIRGLPEFLAPARWVSVVQAFWRGLVAYPIVSALGVILLAGLFFICWYLPARLARLAKPVGRVGDDTIWLTLRAALMTLILTVPVAFLLAGVSRLVAEGAAQGSFAAAVGSAIFNVALLVLYLNFFIQVTRDNGLADAHFKWPAGARRTLLRSLIFLLALLLAPAFIAGIILQLPSEVLRETLGRAAVMFSSLVLAGFAFRFFLPVRGVLSQVFAPEHRTWRAGYFWLPVGVVGSLALSTIAAMGYLYTALQLQTRFFYSFALLGAATVVYGIVVRWLTVVVRRLALRKARQRRDEARQARAAREQGGELPAENPEEPEIGLPQIGTQTQGLIKLAVMLLVAVGLWLIWASTLPAVSVLNEVTLWSNTSTVGGQLHSVNITLGALLLALAVGVGTFIAGRNLPGFLEIAVLQHFSMAAGSRYAVATLFKYGIVVVGILVAVTLIGFQWSSIQWLVAALGVGIGFGLQAIFANFICGLIILFERPVRVGDIVTVGTLTGVISRVRIRATTVTDWDNREVVIPNQTFVTETVTNWTLTDDVARLVLEVRVAYESDTEKVQRLIQQAIDAQPQVLDTPPSTVYLIGFDDSGLRFDGRAYYRDPYNNWMPLQHELYKAIHGLLGDAGVRITFEQQDIHLRSVDDSLAGLFGPPRADQPAPPGGADPDSDADGDSVDDSSATSGTETGADRKRGRKAPSSGGGGDGDGPG